MNAPYVTTHSGRHVNELQGTPSLLDIGMGLSRVVRFAGQGRKFFSVASHSLWLEDLAKKDGEPEVVRLAILLHDAHEALVSDIPTVFKTLQQKQVGFELDRRIFDVFFARFGGYEGYTDKSAMLSIVDRVKLYDRIGLVTEYEVIGPPASTYIEKPQQEHVKFLEAWVRQHERTDSMLIQQQYVMRVVALM